MKKQVIWKYRTYNESFVWSNDGADCAIINNGACDLIVNGLTLSPNASITDTCFGDELNTTTYTFQFVGAGTASAIIKTKYYL